MAVRAGWGVSQPEDSWGIDQVLVEIKKADQKLGSLLQRIDFICGYHPKTQPTSDGYEICDNCHLEAKYAGDKKKVALCARNVNVKGVSK